MPAPNTVDRFWSQTTPEPTTGCWLWMSTVGPTGYGAFALRGINWKAHRLAYHLHRGPIPAGLIVRHRCDTPLCVNPAHLVLGTHAENVADRVRRCRTVTNQGRAPLTPEAISAMQELYASGAFTQAELGRRFGLTQVGASRYLKGIELPRGRRGRPGSGSRRVPGGRPC
jgi:hypothetical protein